MLLVSMAASSPVTAAPGAATDTAGTFFAAAGHSKTHICSGYYQVGVLSKALRVQFESREAESANLQEAIDLMGLWPNAGSARGKVSRAERGFAKVFPAASHPATP